MSTLSTMSTMSAMSTMSTIPTIPTIPTGTTNLATTHTHNLTNTTPTRLLHHNSHPKNHQLIILTNITRHIINKAHYNSTKIHPNTLLYKILDHANIFATFEAQKETSGNASCSSLKFSEIWSSIADSCQNLLKPKKPQMLTLNNP